MKENICIRKFQNTKWIKSFKFPNRFYIKNKVIELSFHEFLIFYKEFIVKQKALYRSASNIFVMVNTIHYTVLFKPDGCPILVTDHSFSPKLPNKNSLFAKTPFYSTITSKQIMAFQNKCFY